MPEKGRCLHPEASRSPGRSDPDRVHCAKCGRDFLPRGATTRHGTYRGYARHVQAKKGEWGWPIGECGCAQAGRDYRIAHDKKPHIRESNLRRSKARLAALHRLRRIHPAEYNVFYTEELAAAGGNPRVIRPPVWDDILARLVKEALGKDEASVNTRIRARVADRREVEVMRYVTRIRLVMDGLMRQAGE